jgi:hypothetical protein
MGQEYSFLRGLVALGGMLKLAKTATGLEGRLTSGADRIKANLPQLAPGIGAAIADRLTREVTKNADDRLVVRIEAIAG